MWPFGPLVYIDVLFDGMVLAWSGNDEPVNWLIS